LGPRADQDITGKNAHTLICQTKKENESEEGGGVPLWVEGSLRDLTESKKKGDQEVGLRNKGGLQRTPLLGSPDELEGGNIRANSSRGAQKKVQCRKTLLVP